MAEVAEDLDNGPGGPSASWEHAGVRAAMARMDTSELEASREERIVDIN